METMTRTSDISLKSDGGCKILMSEQELYVRAAQLVVNYTKTHTVQFDVSSEEIQRMRDEFCEKFSPEKLKALEDEKLLSYIFLTSDGSNDSLCYHLEFNVQLKRTFGSISGGSSFKYGLFQRQEDGKWMTGAPTKQIRRPDLHRRPHRWLFGHPDFGRIHLPRNDHRRKGGQLYHAGHRHVRF